MFDVYWKCTESVLKVYCPKSHAPKAYQQIVLKVYLNCIKKIFLYTPCVASSDVISLGVSVVSAALEEGGRDVYGSHYNGLVEVPLNPKPLNPKPLTPKPYTQNTGGSSEGPSQPGIRGGVLHDLRLEIECLSCAYTP